MRNGSHKNETVYVLYFFFDRRPAKIAIAQKSYLSRKSLSRKALVYLVKKLYVKVSGNLIAASFTLTHCVGAIRKPYVNVIHRIHARHLVLAAGEWDGINR